MNELRAWAVIGGVLAQLVLYRLGLASCPHFERRHDEALVVVGRVLGWRKRLRILGAAQCPKSGPAVFAGNHLKVDDPFCMFRAIHVASGNTLYPKAMMRDDFFKPGILTSRLVDLNELLRLLGALQISREQVQLSQLRPFLDVLRAGGVFMMYPGRSRTRSGLFVEYGERFSEPGAVSFFLAQARRGNGGVEVPVVPMARTYNPATNGTAVCFGEPLYLPDKAGRTEQRALDYTLMERMGQLVEVNAAQITAALLYVHTLHQRVAVVERAAIEDAVARITSNVPGRHVDPGVYVDLAGSVDAALRYFQKNGFLRLRKDTVSLQPEAILAAPPNGARYRKANPLKHLVNELLHLSDVTARINEATLS